MFERIARLFSRKLELSERQRKELGNLERACQAGGVINIEAVREYGKIVNRLDRGGYDVDAPKRIYEGFRRELEKEKKERFYP